MSSEVNIQNRLYPTYASVWGTLITAQLFCLPNVEAIDTVLARSA